MSETENQRVRDILPDTPFRTGGGLNLDTGRGSFVPLEMHMDFKEQVEQNRLRGISIWALAGPVGIGRTWSLCWLARQAREKNMGFSESESTWDAALVPGIGSGNIRDFYESVFAATEHLRDEIQETEDDEFVDTVGGRGVEGILNHAISNRESWAVLTGDKGRFPSVTGVESRPKWTKRDTQVEFLSKWLQLLKEHGVDNLVVLVDEFERTATQLSAKKMVDFSDGLRRLYDIIDQTHDEMPNVQVILSATPESVNKMDPQAASQNLEGWLEALRTRMNRPFYLTNISEDNAKKIAKSGLDYKRITELSELDVDNLFHPYEEAAIQRAFDASDGLTRRFTKTLKEMYIMGYNEETVDEEIAQKAIEHLGYDI